MSFDFKNVKNVRATHLRNEKIENAVSQKTAFSQMFYHLIFWLRYATLTPLNMIKQLTQSK